ncbi:MAG: hypothetical protein WC673_00680 [Candidatus Paceibacterota bacterium]|jgi:uncharacterized protein YwbE
MAEDKKEKKDKSSTTGFGEVFLILIVLFFLWRALAGAFAGGIGGVGDFFNRLNISLNPFSNTAPLGSIYLEKDETLIGKTVFNKENGKVGKIVSGPELRNGNRYWSVSYDDGTNGWVAEDALSEPVAIKFIPGETPVGERAVADGPMPVYDKPGGLVIGNQLDGSPGTITKGPENFGGKDYFFMDFDNGPDGWVVADKLTDENGVPIKYGKTALGGSVMTKDGKIGKITQGPEFRNGERHWFVQFLDGSSGWVKESDLFGVGLKNFDAGNQIIGMKVAVAQSTAVYDEPGGNIIGYQKRGTSGTIFKGPLLGADGKRYWFVDFENVEDGWVAEDNLFVIVEHPLANKFSSLASSALTIFNLFMLTGIVYTLIRIIQISSAHSHKIKVEETKMRVGREVSHPRWEKVRDHLSSENPSDWRLAVMEADIILGEMLEKMGYIKGETIGDKLKTIEKSDFTSLDQAWEAHRIRNMIAHEGADYILTDREAKRVIGLYEQVFKEFRYI